MVMKKYLFSDEFFCSEEQFLIASLLGPGYAAVTFHSPSGGWGGMATFPLNKIDADALLDDDIDFRKLDECIASIQKEGENLSDLKVHVVGTGYATGAINMVGFEYITEKIIGKLTDIGITDIERKVETSPGLKVYFKNWDNTIRIMETEIPKFYADSQEEDGATRVLIVDDSSLVQNILSRMLGRDKELEIIGTASDAFSATELIITEDPDVVILDIVMPQMNGLSFLEQVMKSNPRPVIIFSTMSSKGGRIEEQAYEKGAVDVIDKKKFTLSNNAAIEEIINRIKEAAVKIGTRKEEV